MDYKDGAGRATVYAECRWIGDDVTLTIRHTAPVADYPQSVVERDELLAGLDTTGVVGDNASPAASSIANATPVVSPVASPEAVSERGS